MNTTITEFLDTNYLEYSKYVVENRAIPSYIDGLKLPQRKILEVASRVFKDNSKAIKVVSLTGDLMSKLMYHHGDSSANDAIIGMAQDFKNALPLFDKVGQFGGLRDTVAGAPRYVSVKLSKWFDKLYKDIDLCEYIYEDGIKLEPKHFIPIIPTVLLNGTSGIAVGFASDILNRNPFELTQAVLNVLNGIDIENLKPYWKDFSGLIDDCGNNKYLLYGKWEQLDSNKILISELPPFMVFQKFEKLLDDLIDKKIIVDYENQSKNGVRYIIKFKKDILNEYINENKIEKTFKLVQSYTENLTCLDENKNVIIFNNSTELIKKFVEFRFKFYELRKSKKLKELENSIFILTEKQKFINEVLNKTLIIEKRPKQDIVKDMTDKQYTHIENLLKLSLTVFTNEELDKLENAIKNLKNEFEIVNSTKTKTMYQNDLKDLLKELKK